MEKGKRVYFKVYSYCCCRGFGIELVVAVSYEYWRRESVSKWHAGGQLGQFSYKLIFLRLKVRSLRSLALVRTRLRPS